MREGALFAKLGLCLVSHHRVLSVRPDMRASCFGLYAYAIVFSRANDLDGFVPNGAIDQLAGTDDMVECLVRVGLLARHEQDGVHGFLIHKYAEFNETKAQTSKRLKAQNKWKAESRTRAKHNTHVRPDKALTSPLTPTLTSGLGQARVRPSETETDLREEKRERSTPPALPSTGFAAQVEAVTPLADETHRERAREQITRLAEWAKANGVER